MRSSSNSPYSCRRRGTLRMVRGVRGANRLRIQERMVMAYLLGKGFKRQSPLTIDVVARERVWVAEPTGSAFISQAENRREPAPTFFPDCHRGETRRASAASLAMSCG